MIRLASRALRPIVSRVFMPRVTYFSTTPEFNKVNTKVLNFQTETNKLLDIVAKSLYMDKEVFIRELVSNASDALEKQRYLQVSGQNVDETPLNIKIYIDTANATISIRDTGIGMTSEELIKNLGTIAYSGSGKFIEQLKGSESNKSTAESIIGQFGVGFYSSFIVAKEVRVMSKTDGCANPHLWVSKGLGEFEISEVDGVDFERGTEVTIQLKDESKQFLNENTVKDILKKYSNFVSFPLELNHTQVNIQGALWARSKNEVEESEYQDFFEYISGQKIPYWRKIHFALDIPLSIKVLLYIPNTHKEKFGLSNESLEVSLYSRKVLITPNCSSLLPNWLRFMKGVVDCEDISLNVSRETFQDSAMMAKIKAILTKKVLKFLNEEANKDEDGFMRWYKEFGHFLVEGMAIDTEHSRDIMSLTRYNWSSDENMVTLDRYIASMKEGQNKIYYLFTPNREIGLESPYLETFIPKGIPVIFSYQHVDEMIFRNMGDFKGHKFVNIESAIENLDKQNMETQNYDSVNGIPEADLVPFTEWVKNECKPIVDKVIISTRLKDSPAVVIGDMPSALRQVYKLMEREKHSETMVKNQILEVNPNSEIIIRLNQVRKSDPEVAKDIVSQILDNALLNAGIMENPINMIKRINRILLKSLRDQEKDKAPPSQ